VVKKSNLRLKQKAETRAANLWQHYNETGRLSLADFKRITGGSFDSVMKTFETYGLDAPPVYDSRKEKMRRKAMALADRAAELGQDFLTIGQAAKVLKTKPNRVIGIEARIIRYGFNIPDIVIGEKNSPGSESDTGAYGRINGVINPLIYPQGLQVVPIWFNPTRDEIHYLVI
jgi:hypothetical protein